MPDKLKKISTKELEEEIFLRKRVEEALKITLKKAEEANMLKDAFLSNISHEIRTPLNAIIGFSSLLERELTKLQNENLLEYNKAVQLSGYRLLEVLNNIIDISRIEANDMTVSLFPCDLNEIIENAIKLTSFTANEKGIKVHFSRNKIPCALADLEVISRIIIEIIDNSLKYSEKGCVNIDTKYLEKENEIQISISDTGIGIEKSYLPHIFEAFRQESTGHARTYQGIGLSLPLSKKLIELMNGRISIESKKKIGTTVHVWLKATHCQPDSYAKKSLEFLKNNSKKAPMILVLEDDKLNGILLKTLLQNYGKVILSESGEQALSSIETKTILGQAFDLMIFDINLPGKWDGIKLMKEIKSRWPEYRDVPFIAQTAYGLNEDREKFLKEGFDDYISKPINENLLFSIVDRFIAK
ncbi:MAG: response regulator [Bacteroidetes bacterium]|nr:response regulator [Bacteroidota bacterium]